MDFPETCRPFGIASQDRLPNQFVPFQGEQYLSCAAVEVAWSAGGMLISDELTFRVTPNRKAPFDVLFRRNFLNSDGKFIFEMNATSYLINNVQGVAQNHPNYSGEDGNRRTGPDEIYIYHQNKI